MPLVWHAVKDIAGFATKGTAVYHEKFIQNIVCHEQISRHLACFAKAFAKVKAVNFALHLFAS
ncbi:hypothetical protein ATCC51562_705 [Campylobacter concisus ATCC 51562]|uniref:Uncharacterized protein n=1 Tax=Campylobacter concisus ATCC 51562 TaxID=1242969 RepID=U2F4I3_9BACT|nr:hypothetical protein ATCC51562_705 [Campylobacter concisus ATCC 51562]